jgi:hypothetical protein
MKSKQESFEAFPIKAASKVRFRLRAIVGAFSGVTDKLASTLQLLAACCVLMLLAPNSRAQVTTGDILGTVTDSTGAVISGASVIVTNTGTGLSRQTVTAADGQYTFTELQPGHYSVKISAPTYSELIISDLALVSGDRTRLDESLKVGAVTQNVTVEATTGGLQTDTSTVNETINETATQELPLNGRNIVSLVQVQAGVNTGVPNGVGAGNRPDDRRQTSSMSANGQEELFNLYLVDGLENSDRVAGLIGVQPSIDAIQEVRVNTNLYSAALGRTAGAVVSVITKAGTNEYHGTAYEFLRNNVTDARNFFAKDSVVQNPELRQNQFGGSIGGRILRNKMFFFGDYEGFRQVDATNTVYTSSVPTLFEHDNPGNFTDRGGTVVTNMDPTALAYFKLYPAPNISSTATSNNFLYDPARTQTSHTGDIRLDEAINSSNLLNGRYSFNVVHTFVPGQLPKSSDGVYPGGQTTNTFPGTAVEHAHSGQVNYTHIYSPSLLLELRLGYLRLITDSYPLNYGTNINNSSTYSIPGVDGPYLTSGMAAMSIVGYSPLGDAYYVPIQRTQNTFQYAGALTRILGPHTFKMGAGLIQRQLSLFQSPYAEGRFNWNQGANSVADIEQFLGGTPFLYTRQNQLYPIDLRIWEPSVYVQDDYRVTSKLTLNLGLRYDIFTAASAPNGQLSNVNLSTGKLVINSTGGVSTRYADVAPRFGFAATLDSKTVVRGGYGISFFPTDVQSALPLQNAPNTYSSGTVKFTSTKLSQGIPLPTTPSTTNLSGAVTVKPFDYHTGYMEQYNLNVQRQIGQSTLTVGYVASVGKHLEQQITNADLPAPQGATQGTPPYASVLPNVNTVLLFLDEGFSNYNSLQANLERRLSSGLTFDANYTWGHSLDDLNDGAAFIGSPYGLEPTNINHYDYGNAAQDVRDRFAMTADYSLPFFKGTKGLAGMLLSGWQVNGLAFWQTGPAFTVQSSSPQINLPTVSTDRPNLSGNPYAANKSTSQFLNLSAFTAQTYGTAGSEKPYQIYGPHQRRVDLSLSKTAVIHEGLKFQFRAESFNISNTPNFSVPTNSISGYANGTGTAATTAGGFGTITSTTLSGRQFQFVGKFIF